MALIANVESRFGPRKGRGFSREELKKAGLTLADARKLKVLVDTLRNSIHNSNVAELKKLELPAKKVTKKKPAAKPKVPTKPKKAAKEEKVKARSSAAKIKAIEEEKEKKIQEAIAKTKAEKKAKTPAKKPTAKPKKAAKKPTKPKAVPKKK